MTPRAELERTVKAIMGDEGRDTDLDHCSKGSLVALLRSANFCIARLRLELFCANPTHPVFDGLSEETLADYRRERLRRLSEGGTR